MFYIVLIDPLTNNPKVIKSSFDNIGALELIRNLHFSRVKSILKDNSKVLDIAGKNKILYPLDSTPTEEHDEVSMRYKFVYKKEYIDRGWLYSTRQNIQTTFEYFLAEYDNLPRGRINPSFPCNCNDCIEKSKKYIKEMEENQKPSQSLIDALISSSLFKRRKIENEDYGMIYGGVFH